MTATICCTGPGSASLPRIQNRAKTRDLTGVFGFMALSRKAHLTQAVDHEIVVVFDGDNGATGRTANDAAYKANRAEADHSHRLARGSNAASTPARLNLCLGKDARRPP